MSAFSDLISAIETRLEATAGLSGVSILVEDPEDLATQISKALDEIGALVLIGQPKWRNAKRDSQAAENDVTIEIAIGEAPTIWRDVEKLIEPDGFAATELSGLWEADYSGLVIGAPYRWAPGVNEAGHNFSCGATNLAAAGSFTAGAALALALSSNAGVFTGELFKEPVKPVCSDMAQTVTTRLQGFKAASGFRYLSILSGDPVPDKKRQIYQVVAGTKWIVGPAA